MLANVATLTGLSERFGGLIRVRSCGPRFRRDQASASCSRYLDRNVHYWRLLSRFRFWCQRHCLDRTTRIMDDVDQLALKTVNLLAARRRGTLKGRCSYKLTDLTGVASPPATPHLLRAHGSQTLNQEDELNPYRS